MLVSKETFHYHTDSKLSILSDCVCEMGVGGERDKDREGDGFKNGIGHNLRYMIRGKSIRSKRVQSLSFMHATQSMRLAPETENSNLQLA